MPTPSKEEIERNLNDLLLNWSEDLPEAAIHEINKLIDLHSACLADMPPSSGTAKNESLHKKIKEFYSGKRNLSLEKFIALLTVLFIDHNRSVSNDPTPMITLTMREFENNDSKVDYTGFGLANIDEQVEEALTFGDLDNEDDVKLVKNLDKLISVANSLALQTTALNKQAIIVSCRFKGLHLFTSIIDLARCLMNFNLCRSERREKSLNKTLLQQFQKTMTENVPVSIMIKLSSEEIDFSSIADIQEVSNILGCTLIFLSGDRSCPIQTVIPIELRHEKPVMIGIGQQFFYGTESLPQHQSVLEKPKVQCKCGRNTEIACEKGSKCPCYLSKIDCQMSPECECSKCANPFGSRHTPGKKQVMCYCKKGCCSIDCPCWRRGASCASDPKCRCKECKNDYGIKGEVVIFPDLDHLPQPKHSGKLPRHRDADFYSDLGLKVVKPRWSLHESLFLFLLLDRKVSKNDMSKTNIEKLWKKYNTIANLREVSHHSINTKSSGQIKGKIVTMLKYMDIYARNRVQADTL